MRHRSPHSPRGERAWLCVPPALHVQLACARVYYACTTRNYACMLCSERAVRSIAQRLAHSHSISHSRAPTRPRPPNVHVCAMCNITPCARFVAPARPADPYAKHLMEARHYTDDDFGHTDLPSARGLELFNTPREHAKNKVLMEIDQLESMGGRRAIL